MVNVHSEWDSGSRSREEARTRGEKNVFLTAVGSWRRNRVGKDFRQSLRPLPHQYLERYEEQRKVSRSHTHFCRQRHCAMVHAETANLTGGSAASAPIVDVLDELVWRQMGRSN